MEHKDYRKHFIESLYRTLEDVVSPTPFLEIAEQESKPGEKSGVSVTFLNGKANLPNPKKPATEITVQDVNTAALFFENFNILWEGMSGVGKTYTIDNIGYTVCGRDGYKNIKLSGGVLGTSALDPFTMSSIENGIPRVVINKTACARYGIICLDELNLGEFSEISKILEGRAETPTESVDIQLPIPGTKRFKRVTVYGAMNPADALHTHANELTIAGENRLLKLQFPNGVTEIGSGQKEGKWTDELHEQFWDEVRKKTKLKGTWKELFPLITDSERVSLPLSDKVNEFINVALEYVGTHPEEAFNRNMDIVKASGYVPRLMLRKDNDLDKIVEVQGSLKYGYVRRDVEKIRDFARILGFIRGMKNETYTTDVSMNDITAAIGVVLESKTITGTSNGPLMNLVNDARDSYGRLMTDMKVNPEYAIRTSAMQAAVYAGIKGGFEQYLKTITSSMDGVNRQGGTVSKAVISARLLADLAVLQSFSQTYEKDLTAAFKEGSGAIDAAGVTVSQPRVNKVFEQIGDVYEKHKNKALLYKIRLAPIFE